MRKAIYVLGLMLMSFQVLALSETVKFQFPQENGPSFLATTNEEALCQHLGYKKVVKATSTYIECTNGVSESSTSFTSISNTGREIAIEKGTKNHSKMRFRAASEQ